MIERRACERFIVPGSFLSYQVHGLLGRPKKFPEETFYLVDLSKGGLAFLLNKTLKIGTVISILLYFSEKEEPILLKGTVVYSMLHAGIINQYRIGVQFHPFGDKKGYNSPESLKILERLENTYGSRGKG